MFVMPTLSMSFHTPVDYVEIMFTENNDFGAVPQPEHVFLFIANLRSQISREVSQKKTSMRCIRTALSRSDCSLL